MAASGLSTTDAVRTEIFGGIVAEFIAQVREHYVKTLQGQPEELKLTKDGWFYEPSVAEMVFTQLVRAEEKMLRWMPLHHLVKASVSGRKLVSVILDGPAGAQLDVRARTWCPPRKARLPRHRRG